MKRRILKASTVGAGFCLGAGLCLSSPVQAQQPYELDLGNKTNAALSGTASLTPAGQTASGTYTYYGDEGIEGPLPAAPNTVQILNTYGTSQASVSSGGYYGVSLYNTSTLDFSGGTVYPGFDSTGLVTNDSSTLNLSGGLVSELASGGNSVINLSGGEVQDAAEFYNSSTLHMTGGFIGNGSVGTSLGLGATADISGGGISQVSDFGLLNLSGTGSIGEIDLFSVGGPLNSGIANISGGSVGSVSASDNSVINITGGSFTNGTLTSAGNCLYNLYGDDFLETPLDQIGYAYQVTGTLEDGQKLNATYDDSGGSLVFHDVAPVPEASTTVSLGLLLALGLGSVVLARRKKAA